MSGVDEALSSADERDVELRRAEGVMDRRALAGAAMEPMQKAIALMRVLRSPEGCPWDREQSFDTIKRHTLEEVYEVFDAIERRAWGELRDELGDLLLQVLFYARMAEEAGYFGIADVAHALNTKLIRRHPHVFGEVEVAGTDDVLRNWEQIKEQEKQERDRGEVERKLEKQGSGRGRPAAYLDEVPRSMPGLMEAAKVGSRAAQLGFDWPDSGGLLEKMAEELREVQEEMERPSSDAQRMEEEIGDVLFTAVNLARHLKVDAEGALRSATGKFRSRFQAMEELAGGAGAMRSLSAAEWDALWEEAKAAERGSRVAS